MNKAGRALSFSLITPWPASQPSSLTIQNREFSLNAVVCNGITGGTGGCLLKWPARFLGIPCGILREIRFVSSE